MRNTNMNKDYRLALIIFCSLIGIGLYSCETDGPECYEPINVSLKSAFVRRDSFSTTIGTDTSIRDTTYIVAEDTFLIAPRFTAIDMGTIIYQVTGSNTNATNILGVALDPARDSMRFQIQTDTLSTLIDTITFFYQTSLFFISNNCGYTNYFDLDSMRITRNIFDSAKISNANVTKDGSNKNVLLYLKR